MILKHAEKASENGFGKFKLGAAIYDKKWNLISVGWNKRKTHPKFGSHIYRRLHAEGDALIKALKKKKDLKGHCIVVYRLGGNKAKPCPCCENMLREFGIEKVYYSDNNEYKEFEL